MSYTTNAYSNHTPSIPSSISAFTPVSQALTNSRSSNSSSDQGSYIPNDITSNHQNNQSLNKRKIDITDDQPATKKIKFITEIWEGLEKIDKNSIKDIDEYLENIKRSANNEHRALNYSKLITLIVEALDNKHIKLSDVSFSALQQINKVFNSKKSLNITLSKQYASGELMSTKDKFFYLLASPTIIFNNLIKLILKLDVKPKTCKKVISYATLNNFADKILIYLRNKQQKNGLDKYRTEVCNKVNNIKKQIQNIVLVSMLKTDRTIEQVNATCTKNAKNVDVSIEPVLKKIPDYIINDITVEILNDANNEIKKVVDARFKQEEKNLGGHCNKEIYGMMREELDRLSTHLHETMKDKLIEQTHLVLQIKAEFS